MAYLGGLWALFISGSQGPSLRPRAWWERARMGFPWGQALMSKSALPAHLLALRGRERLYQLEDLVRSPFAGALVSVWGRGAILLP